MATPGNGAQVLGPQPLVGGQHQFGGNHIFAHRSYIFPRGCGGQNLDAIAVGSGDEVRVLDLDYGIAVGRQRITRVEGECLAAQQQQ